MPVCAMLNDLDHNQKYLYLEAIGESLAMYAASSRTRAATRGF